MSQFQLRSHLLIPEGMERRNVLIVGAGTTGSKVAMAMAAIGIRRFTIVDFDTVGIHNLPSQEFTSAQVGYSKAECLAENMMARFGLDGLEVTAINGKFTPKFPKPEHDGYDIIFSGADSMAVRKMVAMWSVGMKSRVVDTRCGGHEIQTWAYDADDREQYEMYLSTHYLDSEASGLPCGGEMYPAAGLVASVTTLAAISTEGWFYRLADTELSVVA